MPETPATPEPDGDDRSFIWVFGDLDDPQPDTDQPA